ncbi:MAG: hypothetical protein O2856_17220 [Planctomycetota bacterium]|nr:hypothetical protein [Planctomycetota bacterium]
MQSTNTKTADVVIIGRVDDSVFCDQLQSLRRNDQLRIVAEYPTLSAGLQAGLGQSVSADFVIVLQSYSDEFTQHQINELIGRLLFSRIVCCYGPWCTADGRSHNLWPVAFRVPAASAPTMIDRELTDFFIGTQSLLPMSAGEEVFAHRSVFPELTANPTPRRAIVISDDSAYRKTVAGILETLSCECGVLPMARESIRSFFTSRQHDRDLVIVDLDGPVGNVCECLDVLHSEFGISKVEGMSVFAASLIVNRTHPETKPPLFHVAHVFEKTELLLQLQRRIY